jgi:hypothetical protein
MVVGWVGEGDVGLANSITSRMASSRISWLSFYVDLFTVHPSIFLFSF